MHKDHGVGAGVRGVRVGMWVKVEVGVPGVFDGMRVYVAVGGAGVWVGACVSEGMGVQLGGRGVRVCVMVGV